MVVKNALETQGLDFRDIKGIIDISKIVTGLQKMII